MRVDTASSYATSCCCDYMLYWRGLLTPRPHFTAPSCTLGNQVVGASDGAPFRQERRPTRICRTPGAGSGLLAEARPKCLPASVPNHVVSFCLDWDSCRLPRECLGSAPPNATHPLLSRRWLVAPSCDYLLRPSYLVLTFLAGGSLPLALGF